MIVCIISRPSASLAFIGFLWPFHVLHVGDGVGAPSPVTSSSESRTAATTTPHDQSRHARGGHGWNFDRSRIPSAMTSGSSRPATVVAVPLHGLQRAPRRVADSQASVGQAVVVKSAPAHAEPRTALPTIAPPHTHRFIPQSRLLANQSCRPRHRQGRAHQRPCDSYRLIALTPSPAPAWPPCVAPVALLRPCPAPARHGTATASAFFGRLFSPERC